MGSRLDEIATTGSTSDEGPSLKRNTGAAQPARAAGARFAAGWILLAGVALLLALSAIAVRIALGPRFDDLVLLATVVSALLLALRLFIRIPDVADPPPRNGPRQGPPRFRRTRRGRRGPRRPTHLRESRRGAPPWLPCRRVDKPMDSDRDFCPRRRRAPGGRNAKTLRRGKAGGIHARRPHGGLPRMRSHPAAQHGARLRCAVAPQRRLDPARHPPHLRVARPRG